MSKKDVTPKAKGPLDDSEWRFDEMPTDLWPYLRDYEFLREVFLRGAPKPEWTANIVELDTGFKEIKIPANEERGRSERTVIVPPEFPDTPFLKLSDSRILWYEDMLKYEEHEAESHKDLKNPLSRFDPRWLLSLIPPTLLRKNPFGYPPLEVVPREEPGKDYVPRTQAQTRRDKDVEADMRKERKNPDQETEAERQWNADRATSGLLRMTGDFVYDYDAADLSPEKREMLKQFSAGEEKLKELRSGQFDEEWVNHYWAKVSDWAGNLHGEDLDEWLKTFRDEAGSCWSVAAFKLDWEMADQAIVDWFRAWLVKHRPQECKKTKKSETDLRLELARLAALRLWRHWGSAAKAWSAIKEVEERERREQAEKRTPADVLPIRRLITANSENSIEKDADEAKKILRDEFDCGETKGTRRSRTSRRS